MLPEVDRCMRRFSARSTVVETVTLSSSDCSKPRQVSLIVLTSFAVLRKESRILALSFKSGRTNAGHARASVARQPQGSWPESVRITVWKRRSETPALHWPDQKRDAGMTYNAVSIEPQMRSCHNKHEREGPKKCRRLLTPVAQSACKPWIRSISISTWLVRRPCR